MPKMRDADKTLTLTSETVAQQVEYLPPLQAHPRHSAFTPQTLRLN